MKIERGWRKRGTINGRIAYTDGRMFYTLDTRHNDIEVWQVTGKKAYHKGSIECIHGTLYKGPTHNVETYN